jgi:hypothetical protein
MSGARLMLTIDEQLTLEQLRDHHPKPELRERAAALLKLAAGWSARRVAREGLLQVRDPESVSHWAQRDRAEGLGGLFVRAGRGRQSAFSPRRPVGGPSHRHADRPAAPAAAGRCAWRCSVRRRPGATRRCGSDCRSNRQRKHVREGTVALKLPRWPRCQVSPGAP